MTTRSRTAVTGEIELSPMVNSKILFSDGRNHDMHNLPVTIGNYPGMPGLPEENIEYKRNFTGFTRCPDMFPRGGLSA